MLRVTPLTPGFGAEVHGTDLAQLTDVQFK
jgi:hypothetical protein